MGKENVDLNLVVRILFSASLWKTEATDAHLEVMGLPWEALALWDKTYFSGRSLRVPQGLCGPQEKEAVQLHCSSFCFPSQTSHIRASGWPWITYVPYYGLCKR